MSYRPPPAFSRQPSFRAHVPCPPNPPPAQPRQAVPRSNPPLRLLPFIMIPSIILASIVSVAGINAWITMDHRKSVSRLLATIHSRAEDISEHPKHGQYIA
eukprot:GHVT01094553.1.p3 GENE.GHVT01094553.1~~GHVT01094553.1.p3  ORF type:complete len:101 (+),score=5.61 GHVT01094553.1:545-847(+)